MQQHGITCGLNGRPAPSVPEQQKVSRHIFGATSSSVIQRRGGRRSVQRTSSATPYRADGFNFSKMPVPKAMLRETERGPTAQGGQPDETSFGNNGGTSCCRRRRPTRRRANQHRRLRGTRLTRRITTGRISRTMSAEFSEPSSTSTSGEFSCVSATNDRMITSS